MRWFLAAVILVGLVGCQEKEVAPVVDQQPVAKELTAAERATLYLAAKAEIEEIQKERAEINRFRRSIIESGVEIPPEVEKNHQLRFELFRLKEMEAEQIMKDNAPTGS